ncbi:hypothetical protein DSL72_008779 [Monilinia vaccinii-corymbosi]|uniref:Uncharacterized protein n=1 Tax=Monilinia vaccinii-corymbosi TaxID=61207 RepID=A0A8A3PRA1_9HELO|nr:hypothetical protein DSL72_008779 [Monilinia vaccinii-corymbosi]
MSRSNAPNSIFELAFADCYISDDRPRHVKKTVLSRAIPVMSFDDDFYREPGPLSEPRITSNFKATKAICDYARDGPKSLKFWKLFKRLPIKVRNNIYKLLIFAWSPDAQWARLSRNGRRFSVSRRSSIARPLAPFHYLSDDPLGVKKEDLADWTKMKNWEQSEGLLDFFKLNEYQNIQKLVSFVEKVESRLQLDRSNSEAIANKGKGKQIQKSYDSDDENINLWEEVVAFFWDNIIIDFGERLHFGTIFLGEVSKQINVQQNKCTTKDKHAEIKHICLHLDTIRHTGNHKKHHFSDHCEVCQFLFLCRFIREHFQNVKTLLLYLSLPADSMHDLTSDFEGFAKDIVRAIRSLKVSEAFDVRVRIVNEDDRREDYVVVCDDSVLDNWSKEAQPWFQDVLAPQMISENQATRHDTPI